MANAIAATVKGFSYQGRIIPRPVLEAMTFHGVTWESVFEAPVTGLFNINNAKTVKGEAYGYVTNILYLAPSVLSGLNTCASATAGCTRACLGTEAGHAAIIKTGERSNNVLRARIRKTLWYFYRRDEFMARLVREIENALKRNAQLDMDSAFRLNGTSDLRWETVPVTRGGQGFANIFAAFPEVRFYDYTKHSNRRIAGIPNYSVTFSLAESNAPQALQAFANGLNVAMVFRSAEIIPEHVHLGPAEIPTFDGDASDLRFLDPRGVVVALYAKGGAKHDTSGFVHDSGVVALRDLVQISAA